MQLTMSIDIATPPESVWSIIADIEASQSVIQGIDSIEILEPASGPSITGLKWRETRTMFGREATEVMWITDAKENAHYDTRAESHGAVYTTRLAIEPTPTGSTLSMTFEGIPQTTGAKVMWALTGWMAKGAMKKALAADLADIKASAEGGS